MPGIVELVERISNHVVAALAEAGAPPLVDGQILFGRQFLKQAGAPPRIVFIPTGGKYGPPSPGPARTVQERRDQLANKSLATEKVIFEVHIWGADSTDDPGGNFDAAQYIAHQVIRSADAEIEGVHELLDGKWIDSASGSGDIVVHGREYVFGLAVATPVLREALDYAPSDVTKKTRTILDPNDGSGTEVGCSSG